MNNDVKRRYMNDPVFHAVVTQMRVLISGAHLAPSEVREAAMLACIIEQERVPFSVELTRTGGEKGAGQ